MKEKTTRKKYNEELPKKERLNLKISKTELDKLDKLAKRRNMNRSQCLRKLINVEDHKYTRSFSTYKCDKCGTKIGLDVEYYCEVASIEKQTKEGNTTTVEVIEGKDLVILCYPCAQKIHAIDYVKTGDPTYPTNQIKESKRTIWEK